MDVNKRYTGFVAVSFNAILYGCFLCPPRTPHTPVEGTPLSNAGVGYIAFRRDVTSVRPYVRTFVCHIFNQS